MATKLTQLKVMLTVVMIVIVTTGASCVGESLKINNSLQELAMGYNPIGDDGMSSIADGLQCNNTLTKLYVKKCGFSVKGTLVCKTEFGHSGSLLVLVYLVKQDHFDQIDDILMY